MLLITYTYIVCLLIAQHKSAVSRDFVTVIINVL